MKRDLYYIGALIVFALIAIYFYQKSTKHQAEADRRESIIREKSDSIKYITNEFNRVVATKPAATVNTDELKEFYAAELEKIRKEFDIKTKEVKALVVAKFAAQGSGNATVTPIVVTNPDGTTEEMSDFTFNDNFLTFKSRIFAGEETAPSQYTYTDEFTFAFHTKKKNWFAKEQLYGSGSFKNPNARITKATEVLVDNYKDKRFGVGVTAGFGAMVVQQEIKVGWVVSAGVTYNFIKF